jgi:hypothetical protein
MDKVREAIEKEQELVRRYLGDVPWDVRKAIAPFECRQWHLLVMAARCPGALDLITSNPALAYCVASCWVFGSWPSGYATRVMRSLLHSRRRKICGALGFEESESAVSVLGKIPASACSVSWLLTIRDLLKDPDWRKPLLHLPSLNLAVMQLLCSKALRRRTTPRLLHELAGIDGPALSWWADDVMRMQRQLGDAGNKRFNSVQQFMRLHDELMERIHRPKEADVRRQQFPPPPMPGSGDIVALETPDSLIEEARCQRNCAMSYADDIADGGIYLYRVLQPERATLSIVPGENGGWQIGQLLRAHNEPVSEATYQGVAQWLSRAH